MDNLLLDRDETAELDRMIELAETYINSSQYNFEPEFIISACSCTAHKKSCGWD